MNISKKNIIVNKTPEQLFELLDKPENFKDLISDKVKDFEARETSFSFKFKGMPSAIVLHILNKEPFSKIEIGTKNSPMSVNINISITPQGSDQSVVNIEFEGGFNAMVAMMVKKPLGVFMDDMESNLMKL
ncbi:MAG: hypothetical protein HRT66_08855 [Flavobacteriaceae bacterium]|nr:hypothetical protein [Flavobacteriaceae bacterium]